MKKGPNGFLTCGSLDAHALSHFRATDNGFLL